MFHTKGEAIGQLLDAVREAYGIHAIVPYGDWDDPRSVGFRILDIPATFSAIAEDRLPEWHYSIQIEWYPPQDMLYLYTDRAVSLWGFLDLIKRMSGPVDSWPKNE
jgi:hypothetical protein